MILVGKLFLRSKPWWDFFWYASRYKFQFSDLRQPLPVAKVLGRLKKEIEVEKPVLEIREIPQDKQLFEDLTKDLNLTDRERLNQLLDSAAMESYFDNSDHEIRARGDTKVIP